MDRCPSELWTQIFRLACTDGGVTGCAIALSSHYFREIVLPMQLDNVALCGLVKTSAFADLLEQREPAHRRVRHLFLSDTSDTPAYLDAIQSVAYHTKLDPVLFRILTTIAPDLLTLTCTLPSRTITSTFDTIIEDSLDVAFPRLTELTLNANSLTVPACQHGCFPSLRYFNVLSNHHCLGFNDIPTFPTPPYVRLSTVAHPGSLSTLNECLIFFFALIMDTSQIPSAEEFRLRRNTQETATQTGEDGQNKQLCNAMLVLDKNKNLVFEMVDAYPSSPRDDWEDRIRGGYGCWGERAVWKDT